jgi:hypothetical protein
MPPTMISFGLKVTHSMQLTKQNFRQRLYKALCFSSIKIGLNTTICIPRIDNCLSKKIRVMSSFIGLDQTTIKTTSGFY